MSSQMKKRIGAGLAATVAAAVLAAGAWHWWSHRPLPMPTTAEEAVANIGSTRYRNMPDYRQQEYREQAWRLMEQLPREQRRALAESNPNLMEARRQQMDDRIRSYVLADAATRAQMDREAEARMAQWRQNRPQGEQRPPGPPGPPDRDRNDPDRQARFREHMEQRFEQGNPQLNGWISEYFRLRRERQQNQQAKPNLG